LFEIQQAKLRIRKYCAFRALFIPRTLFIPKILFIFGTVHLRLLFTPRATVHPRAVRIKKKTADLKLVVSIFYPKKDEPIKVRKREGTTKNHGWSYIPSQ
jgi:hypothetical protein